MNKYIVIDGGECSGKSTVIEYLKKKIPEGVFTREPGGGCQDIRECILNEKHDALTEAYLFAAARASTIHNIVKPALDEGKLVISDRSFTTSVVYQGRTLGAEKIVDINRHAIQSCKPDLVIILDIDTDCLQERLNKRASNGGEVTHFDKMSIDIHETIRRGFHSLETTLKECGIDIPVVIIDAKRPPENIVEDVLKIIQK